MLRRIVAGLSAVTLSGLATPGLAAEAACDTPAARAAVEDAVRGWFAAAAKDDAAGVQRLSAPTFFAYDAGQRLEGPALFNMVRGAHAQGLVLEWNLSRFVIHADCHIAWAAWENHGRVGPSGALQPIEWQESASLSQTSAGWVLEFLHSNRVEPTKP